MVILTFTPSAKGSENRLAYPFSSVTTFCFCPFALKVILAFGIPSFVTRLFTFWVVTWAEVKVEVEIAMPVIMSKIKNGTALVFIVVASSSIGNAS